MATAAEARAWAGDHLRGIGNSLYTPFAGRDGDEIDWEAYRYLVRYCAGDLGHPMLWLTSGLAEFWSLTIPERKKLLEVAIEEARAINKDVVIQSCTAANAAKDCLELTLHAQDVGADIVYIQTPMMETHGGEGVLRFFQYVAERTDIALGMFNSPSSGYVCAPAELARIYNEIPAVCAIKNGLLRPGHSRVLKSMAPGLIVWECDTMCYRAGWYQQGIVSHGQLGGAAYVYETPENRTMTPYFELLWAGKIEDAIAFSLSSGLEALSNTLAGAWFTTYPGRPDYFTHWGEAFKYAASLFGLPIGSYPHSRPPQAILPEEAKRQIKESYEQSGLIPSPAKVRATA